MTANQIANRQAKEQARHNAAYEANEVNKTAETKRSNQTRERETYRSNRASESLANRRLILDAVDNAVKHAHSQMNTGVNTLKAFTAKGNDPAWYNHNEQLAKDVANFSFLSAFGRPFPDDFKSTTPTVPGVMALDFIPGIGSSQDKGTAVNIAARAQYSFIRHMNSGSKNYEAPDLMLYYLAMGSAYSLHAEMRRLYSVLNTYSATNRYVGQNLVEVLGYSYNDFIGNLADFRSYINSYALRLSALKVPANMNYFKRWYYLCQCVMMEDEVKSDMAQMYLYRPYGFYTYNESDIGQLDLKVFASSGRTLSSLKTYAEELLQALTTSEDINIMSGDINKAYGDNVFSVPQIDGSEPLAIIRDKLELIQFANTTLPNHGLSDLDVASCAIKQDEATGAIYCAPSFTAAYDQPVYKLMIEADQLPKTIRKFGMDPNPAETLEMCANVVGYKVESTSTQATSTIVASSNIIPLGARVYTRDAAGNLTSFEVRYVPLESTYDFYMLKSQAPIQFYYCPMLEMPRSNADSTYYHIGHLEDFAIIDQGVIKNINDAIALSVFGVPVK